MTCTGSCAWVHMSDTHVSFTGKWHLGYYEPKFCPWNRGFDYFEGFLNSAEDHFNHSIMAFCPADLTPKQGPGWQCGAHMGRQCLRDSNCSYGLDYRRGSQADPKILQSSRRYSTYAYQDATIAFIHNHSNHSRFLQQEVPPMFLYVSFSAVHIPLQAPKEWIDRFVHIAQEDRRVYVAMAAAGTVMYCSYRYSVLYIHSYTIHHTPCTRTQSMRRLATSPAR
jgi:arylsulfatase B/arylsulfatase I/J